MLTCVDRKKCFPRNGTLSLLFLPFQQGHSPSFYRDHPQDIRHRTVQSRRPPPISTHLIKGDPDSATSPSKYAPATDNKNLRAQLPDVAMVEGTGSPVPSPTDLKALEEAARDQEEYEQLPVVSPSKGKVNFRTLSTSSSDGEGQKILARPKKTPLPRRKARRRSPPKKAADSESVDNGKKQVLKTQRLARQPILSKDAKTPLQPLSLQKSDNQKNPPDTMAKTAQDIFDDVSEAKVSHKDIQKFLHKSKMGMDVKDIRRAMMNAKVMGKEEEKAALNHRKPKFGAINQEDQKKRGPMKRDVPETYTRTRVHITIHRGHKGVSCVFNGFISVFI